MAPSCYVMDYSGRFYFAAPPTAVWSTIERFDQFERWWGWLGGFRVKGDGLRVGAVLEGTVAPPLPYRMAVRVELTSCQPCELVDADVSGDVVGEAHLHLHRRGHGTVADVAWDLEMMQRPMRMAALVAHPLLRWAHDRVVEVTVGSFRSQVERPRAERCSLSRSG